MNNTFNPKQYIESFESLIKLFIVVTYNLLNYAFH